MAVNLRERSDRCERLIARKRELGLSSLALRRLTQQADPTGKGVAYLTILRMVEGAIPRMAILDRIEDALNWEERKRDRDAA